MQRCSMVAIGVVEIAYQAALNPVVPVIAPRQRVPVEAGVARSRHRANSFPINSSFLAGKAHIQP